jgi:hypothetical protein
LNKLNQKLLRELRKSDNWYRRIGHELVGLMMDERDNGCKHCTKILDKALDEAREED